MKADIHPNYNDVNVTCSCGNTFSTRSTISIDALTVEVCSACHPFYTGQQKSASTSGRVDRFNKRFSR
jgi:large subunit ribosomal protein L31